MTTPSTRRSSPQGCGPHRTEQRHRTIFDNAKTRYFYDQIAWSSNPDGTPLLQDITYTQRAGSFDFLPTS